MIQISASIKPNENEVYNNISNIKKQDYLNLK